MAEIRLSKLTKQFSIGLQRLVDFLNEKGANVEMNPNAKISDEYLPAIEAKFGKETGDAVRIQYGGSMNPKNASELMAMPEIDGGLIALTRFQGEIGFYPDEYIEIIRTYLGK